MYGGALWWHEVAPRLSSNFAPAPVTSMPLVGSPGDAAASLPFSPRVASFGFDYHRMAGACGAAAAGSMKGKLERVFRLTHVASKEGSMQARKDRARGGKRDVMHVIKMLFECY
jgi:hypothetical protein